MHRKGVFYPLPGQPLCSVLRGAVAPGARRWWHLLGDVALLSAGRVSKVIFGKTGATRPVTFFCWACLQQNPTQVPGWGRGRVPGGVRRARAPARWLSARQLGPVCFPAPPPASCGLLTPELQDQPSHRRELCSGCFQSLLTLLRDFRMCTQEQLKKTKKATRR